VAVRSNWRVSSKVTCSLATGARDGRRNGQPSQFGATRGVREPGHRRQAFRGPCRPRPEYAFCLRLRRSRSRAGSRTSLAAACGFADPRRLTRAFTAVVNTAPEVRRRNEGHESCGPVETAYFRGAGRVRVITPPCFRRPSCNSSDVSSSNWRATTRSPLVRLSVNQRGAAPRSRPDSRDRSPSLHQRPCERRLQLHFAARIRRD
jgi:hypothetical protein